MRPPQTQCSTLVLCVANASVLLDLRNGHVLGSFAALPYRCLVPDALMAELDRPLRSMVRDFGLEIGGLEPATVLEIWGLRSVYPHLSVTDLSALFLARDRRAVLLTGDSRLKRLAEAQGLTVRNTLWVLDELFQRQVLNKRHALAALERMLASGAHLPARECHRRQERWSEESGTTPSCAFMGARARNAGGRVR